MGTMVVERVGEGHREGGRRRGWTVPAVAVGGVLLVMIVLGRAGAPPVPGATMSGMPVATPGGTTAGGGNPGAPLATPPPNALRYLPSIEFLQRGEFEMAPDQWPDHYADGIPASFDGAPVYRLSAAMHLASTAEGGRRERVQIGGWYAGPGDIKPGCEGASWPDNCPPARLADDPIRLSQGPAADVDGLLSTGSGPLVIRGTIQVSCALGPGGPTPICWAWIVADELVWRGDAFTDTKPATVLPLLAAMADALAGFSPRPFHAYGRCSIDLPRQSYFSPTGEIEFALVYVTTADRVDDEARRQGIFDSQSDCVAPGTTAPARWITHENVAIGLRDGNEQAAGLVAGLLDELAP